MATKYVYNCSNKPEINEFINSIIEELFPNSTSTAVFEAAMPSFIIKTMNNENIDESASQTLFFRLSYGLLATLPNSFLSKLKSSFSSINFPMVFSLSTSEIIPEGLSFPDSNITVPSGCAFTVGGPAILMLSNNISSVVLLDFQENKIYLIAKPDSSIFNSDNGDKTE